ncbi:LamG-like jellyroll fold domain-containing protein [Carboxylicivirga sp. N1Y90]|uniref:LamG-like jellyroll fold domain-containing protein n=1 Tax=Carboxylicivirga fragile TaxID=3417571 RepID=UPI003D33B4AD|nr:endonuclease/exonuclease/phosphatase family protein [Marinilabiliaceae bacterium N1Y90]
MILKNLVLALIILIYFDCELRAQETNERSEPVIALELNEEVPDPSLRGNDSIVNGIEGKALYFSNDCNTKGHLFKNSDQLSELWTGGDFSIVLWVQTSESNKDFQVIAANKDWNSGEIKDFTDNRYFGFSRTSGVNKGWAIVCQPDGSWAWNIGNGKHDGKEVRVESFRKDYRPTAPRQQINDGEWHQIAFTVNRNANEARLYFDGQNVAIYYMGPVKDLDSGLPICVGNDPLYTDNSNAFNGAIDEFKVYDYLLDEKSIASNYSDYVPVAKLAQLSSKPIEELNVMTWNIWHGGRRHGREIGPQQVIDFIKDTDTDIVMMQETYGSGPLIADQLGYYFYLSSANISVISKYPINKTKMAYHELWSGICNIQLSEKQSVNLASIWLHYLPSIGQSLQQKDITPDELIAGESKTRHKEIKIILDSLKNEIDMADEVPLLIGGDFNSPSHIDWVESTKDWHYDLAVEWPVSKIMQLKGFKDSFREIHADLNYSSSTIEAKDLSFRIDYIYYKGKSLQAEQSDMHFQYKGIWPSDHPALITTFKLK